MTEFLFSYHSMPFRLLNDFSIAFAYKDSSWLGTTSIKPKTGISWKNHEAITASKCSWELYI